MNELQKKLEAALATPEPFRQWLVDNPERTFQACNSAKCPLSEYLTAALKLPSWQVVGVDADYVAIVTPNRPPFADMALPYWAQDFIADVDDVGGREAAVVTSEFALKALDWTGGAS